MLINCFELIICLNVIGVIFNGVVNWIWIIDDG